MAKINKDFFLDVDPCRPRRHTLNLENNPTVLLVWAANRFNRSASRHYQKQFGISAMEWRMLVTLCKEPGLPVSAASPMIGYDKGAVSRSLSKLTELGLARYEVQGTNARNKLWFLTADGYVMHDKVLQSALERQQHLLEGFTLEELQAFNDTLKKFMRNVEALGDATDEDGDDED